MKTLLLLIVTILFFILVPVICSIPAVIELISAYKARIESERKSWVAKEYAKACREYWQAFDAYALALENDDPQSEEVFRLYKWVETKAEAHQHFLGRLKAA